MGTTTDTGTLATTTLATAPAAAPPDPVAVFAELGGVGAANPLAAAAGYAVGASPLPAAVFAELGGVGAANRLSLAVAALVPTVRPADRRNRTALWLEANWSWVFDSLVVYLSRKLRLSKGMGLVEDHVQTFLARLIERDDLGRWLAQGLKVQGSVLKVWAYQSACTESRGWGTDASCRTSRGARTAREREPGTAPKPVQAAETARAVVVTPDGGGPVESVDLYDPAATRADDVIEDRERARAVRRILQQMNAGESAAYVGLVRGLLAGRSLADLTSQYGIDPTTLPGFVEKMRGMVAAQMR